MCGFAGILDLDRPVDHARVSAMTRLLEHRGPDGEGFWSDSRSAPRLVLGHRRLAIRDPGPAGQQPFECSANAAVVAYNGELYNDSALRDELTRNFGCQFNTRCDTEVLPAAWRAWGIDMFAKLEGMYAFALVDLTSQELILARDHAGMKPLFVAEEHRQHALQRVTFASELNSLVAGLPRRATLNPQELPNFLAQGYCGPQHTLLNGVEQLAPGTLRIYSLTSAKVRQVQHYHWQRQGTQHNATTALQAFEEAMQLAVDRHLVSDVPLGSLQSAGIDSSLINAFLRNDANVELYSAAVDSRVTETQDFDESALAAAIARHLKRPLTQVTIPATNLEADFLSMAQRLGGTLADSSALMVYRLFKAMPDTLKVVLAGDGADEIAGGYDTYRTARVASVLHHLLPGSWLASGATWLRQRSGSSNARYPIGQTLGRLLWAASQAEPHAEFRRLMFPSEAQSLYQPQLSELGQHLGTQRYARHIQEAGGSTDGRLLADQRYYLPADMLLKVDHMSMAHGVEVRLPFLDRDVLALLATIHWRHLCPTWGQPKPLLRQALANHGFADNIVRRRKTGFNAPVAWLLRGPLAALGEDNFVRNCDRLTPWFAADSMRRLWQAHKDGSADHGYLLWALLGLAIWLDGQAIDA